jgi:RNA recognition motif-containing protein
MNIYVGNLSHGTVEDDLRRVFESYGEVLSINVIKNGYTGDSRGFGFVEMSSEEDGKKAIAGLHGTELQGRALNVKEAHPRTDGSGGPLSR